MLSRCIVGEWEDVGGMGGGEGGVWRRHTRSARRMLWKHLRFTGDGEASMGLPLTLLAAHAAHVAVTSGRARSRSPGRIVAAEGACRGQFAHWCICCYEL